MHNPNNFDIEYRVSQRRRTIGLMVTNRGRVVVTGPRGVSEADLARAVEKHRAWIECKVAERREAWSRLQAGVVHFLGQPLRLSVLKGAKGPVSLNGNVLRVPVPDQADLWFRLQLWYRQQAQSFITTKVSHYAPRMGLTVGPVELKEWKRRWGECHPDGKLVFNWRLIMLPPEIIDYVVVHELAHLEVPGHNPRFWRRVGTEIADYAVHRQWLNRTGAPFLLWQPELTASGI